MGTKNELIIKLEKTKKLIFTEFFDLFLKLLVILFIISFIFKINYKLFSISLFSIISFILIISYVNKDLIHGFDIFTGGNDGILYMSYGNVLFSNLITFNFYEFFRGVESVFYFPSSLRYFWSINKVLFGETFFGYLTIAYLYPIILFFIFVHTISIVVSTITDTVIIIIWINSINNTIIIIIWITRISSTSTSVTKAISIKIVAIIPSIMCFLQSKVSR